jgi:hypothetical protein
MKILSLWIRVIMIFRFYKKHLLILIIKKSLEKDQKNFLFIEKNKDNLGMRVLLMIKNKKYKNKVFNQFKKLNCNYQIFKNSHNLYKKVLI